MKPAIPPLSPEAQKIQMGVYEHYKGGEYEVIAVARDSEDMDEYVVYRTQFPPYDTWIRPVSEFCEVVQIDGEIVPRFSLIEV